MQLLLLLLQAREHVVIRDHQVIRGCQVSSEVVRCHQRSSGDIRGYQRSSEDIRGHQRSSEVIRGHQRSLEVIRGHQSLVDGASHALSTALIARRGTQRPSDARSSQRARHSALGTARASSHLGGRFSKQSLELRDFDLEPLNIALRGRVAESAVPSAVVSTCIQGVRHPGSSTPARTRCRGRGSMRRASC